MEVVDLLEALFETKHLSPLVFRHSFKLQTELSPLLRPIWQALPTRVGRRIRAAAEVDITTTDTADTTDTMGIMDIVNMDIVNMKAWTTLVPNRFPLLRQQQPRAREACRIRQDCAGTVYVQSLLPACIIANMGYSATASWGITLTFLTRPVPSVIMYAAHIVQYGPLNNSR